MGINNYRIKIIETLEDHPTGLTITELSDKTGAHRNTVSSHIRSLEKDNLVIKKEIGSAHLYFSKTRAFISKDLINSFMKGLLSALKDIYPDDQEKFKEVGKRILNKFEFPIGEAYKDEFKKARLIKDTNEQIKLFSKLYNSYDFFQDDIDIEIKSQKENRIVFRVKNSEYLQAGYVYFFYIVCGITEEIYQRFLDINVNCDVIRENISAEDTYIDFLITPR
jgi:DNA-binding transcriptional ArsR family regulator